MIFLQARRLHVQQRAEPARHRLEEPDVHDRGGQFDVPHALAADAAVRDLDAAAVADHALVLHAAVLAAGAFPVLFRAEDALAEQAVFFRAVGAVVDRLRLLDFAERPAADVVRAGQADADRAVVVDAIVLASIPVVSLPIRRSCQYCSVRRRSDRTGEASRSSDDGPFRNHCWRPIDSPAIRLVPRCGRLV